MAYFRRSFQGAFSYKCRLILDFFHCASIFSIGLFHIFDGASILYKSRLISDFFHSGWWDPDHVHEKIYSVQMHIAPLQDMKSTIDFSILYRAIVWWRRANKHQITYIESVRKSSSDNLWCDVIVDVTFWPNDRRGAASLYEIGYQTIALIRSPFPRCTYFFYKQPVYKQPVLRPLKNVATFEAQKSPVA